MRRVVPLALVISCACAAKPARVAPVGNATDKPAKHATKDPLGLAEGMTWTFDGTVTADDGGHDVTRPIELTTTVASVVTTSGRTTYEVRGWPDYEASSNTPTTIVVEDGVVSVAGAPWIRITPKVEAVTCPDDDLCWTVEAGEGDGFDITLRTNPDVTVYHLDPARGITEFTYHHNGTTDDVELHRKDLR